MDAVSVRGLVIGGREQISYERLDTRYMRAAHEFLATADVVAVRSAVERGRLCESVGRHFLHTTVVAPFDTQVPRPRGSRAAVARSIVVWAPELPAQACGILAYALEEFRRPAIVICAGGEALKMRGETHFVSITQAEAALEQAAVIVDGTLSDPGTTRALARWNVPLAAASTAGALDYLDGITIFEPWNYRSIRSAVANALGYRAPRERDRERDEAKILIEALDWASPGPPPDGPKVSVVVPTMNGRESLVATLQSIADQTYSNVEIIVVNDGGPPIDRMLPGSPRLVEYSNNRGACDALNIGIAAATGKYIALLADDDVYCPEHLARLLEPLERNGGEVAHSIELAEHFEGSAAGALRCIGHSLISGEPATSTSLLIWNYIGGPSIMFSRAAFERTGPFDSRAGHLCDLEMWIRMSALYEFAHVDRVTAVMSMRDDTSQASAISGADTAAFYDAIYKLHPTGRPLVERNRAAHLAEVTSIVEVHTLPQLRLS